MLIIDLLTYVIAAFIGISTPVWIIICVVLFVKASHESDVAKKKKIKRWALLSIILPFGLIFLAILIRIIAHILINI